MKRLTKRLLVALTRRLLGVLEQAQSEAIRRKLKSCGRDVTLHTPLVIAGAEHVSLGDNVSVGPFVHMWGQGGIRVGDRVMIGAHTAITTLTHDYTAERMQDTLLERSVSIEDDVWIGGHAVILPGVSIGKGAVIGAGAVATKDVEPYSIVVGVPARPLKSREARRPDA